MRFRTLVFLFAAACATTSETIPQAWLSVPEAQRIRSVDIDGPAASNTLGVRVETNAIGPRLVRDGKDLTEPFMRIDSFDVSESRGEVVFSAMRDDDFDIGLVSTDGSPINWVPPEPVDETGVKWAPRGNKIAYIVRARGGDFVRVVHIPTAFQLTHDFTYAKIHSLGWDLTGDTIGIAYSTPDASDRLETMQYEGRDRRMTTKPAAALDVDVASFGADGVLLQRRDIGYGETLPVVLWIDEEPYAWSNARAELMRSARVALVVAKRLPNDDAWKNAPQWMDRTRLYVVNVGTGFSPSAAGLKPGATSIVADSTLSGTAVRRKGHVVAVAPAVVQSFAARFIADQLKRITPPNG